jgi:hypothetical protein
MSRSRQQKDWRLRALANGGSTTVPADQAREVIATLVQRMSYSAIAAGLNTTHNYVTAIHRGQIRRISPGREQAILALHNYRPTGTHHVTPIPAQRRLHALAALGWTWAQIAREADGYSLTGIKHLSMGLLPVIESRNDEAIRRVYNKLCMTTPTPTDRVSRAHVTRTKARAAANGWAPPLAYNNIDDLDETPADWQYVAGPRTEQVNELDAQGVSISEACRRLNCTRDALEKWAERNGMGDVYKNLVARETGQNRWPDGAPWSRQRPPKQSKDVA